MHVHFKMQITVIEFYLSPGTHVQEGICWFLGDVEFTHIEGGCGQITIPEWFISGEEGFYLHDCIVTHLYCIHRFIYKKNVIFSSFVIEESSEFVPKLTRTQTNS